LHLPVIIPNWLEEIELRPLEGLQPVEFVQAVPEIRTRTINKALAAEELYLRLRSKLNSFFEDRYNHAQYDELIEKLEKLETNL